jgi:hypothetical protein
MIWSNPHDPFCLHPRVRSGIGAVLANGGGDFDRDGKLKLLRSFLYSAGIVKGVITAGFFYSRREICGNRSKGTLIATR